MVKGLEIFKEHFAGFEDNYVIIGGTACDIALRDSLQRTDSDIRGFIEIMKEIFGIK